MEELSERLHEKIKELAEGKLDIKELEALTDDARELYERLLILKYKAYEQYGKPKEETVKEKVEPIKEELKQLVEAEPEAVEGSIDFSRITEVKEEEVEQVGFDFSAIEEETQEEIDAEEPKEDVIEIAKDIQVDAFKDSHVEKLEAEDENSLNEKLKSEEEQSLRKQFQSAPVSDIKKEISIAKKFEYITFMFEGKNELYEAAIEDLNNCASGEEAKNKLNDYAVKHNWDLENKSIIKFVELVERRYL